MENESNEQRLRQKGKYTHDHGEDTFEISVMYHEFGKEVTHGSILVHKHMQVGEVKTRLLEYSINNSEFDQGSFLGQDFYEDESYNLLTKNNKH